MKRSPEVDAWFDAYDNPQKAGVQRVRELVLAADPRVTECIKWKAPTFVYKGNLASFFPRSKKHVSLMFHQGALIPGDHPLLTGDGATRRTARFASLEDIEAQADALRAVVRAWCAWRDG